MAVTNSESPSFKVVPWNGHRAAISLTFDDGDDSHLDVAVPELNQRKMPGTFYLIANRLRRTEEWRGILEQGHEIGNHSLDHRRSKDLDATQEEVQVVEGRNVLEKAFGTPIRTFCYPYSDVSPGLKKWAGQSHLLARSETAEYFMRPESEPDWALIGSKVTLTALPFPTYQSWMDQALQTGSWLVFMIHGLENSKGWEPISRRVFAQILDYLKTRDYWVDSLLRVGAYFRAQKSFEKGKMESHDGKIKWMWKVPAHFPDDLWLKLKPEPSFKGKIIQGKKEIPVDENGIGSILFNQAEVTLE